MLARWRRPAHGCPPQVLDSERRVYRLSRIRLYAGDGGGARRRACAPLRFGEHRADRRTACFDHLKGASDDLRDSPATALTSAWGDRAPAYLVSATRKLNAAYSIGARHHPYAFPSRSSTSLWPVTAWRDARLPGRDVAARRDRRNGVVAVRLRLRRRSRARGAKLFRRIMEVALADLARHGVGRCSTGARVPITYGRNRCAPVGDLVGSLCGVGSTITVRAQRLRRWSGTNTPRALAWRVAIFR